VVEREKMGVSKPNGRDSGTGSIVSIHVSLPAVVILMMQALAPFPFTGRSTTRHIRTFAKDAVAGTNETVFYQRLGAFVAPKAGWWHSSSFARVLAVAAVAVVAMDRHQHTAAASATAPRIIITIHTVVVHDMIMMMAWAEMRFKDRLAENRERE
jgi:anti-sigma-K factor RskA